MGLQTFAPAGSYFLTALLPELDAETLVREGGVAIIPGSAFYLQNPAPRGLVRFAFCKTEVEIEQALERLEGYLKKVHS